MERRRVLDKLRRFQNVRHLHSTLLPSPQPTQATVPHTASPESQFVAITIAIVAGIITAVTIIISEISLASLIYAGPLRQFLGQGIGFCLLGVVVLTLIVGVTSSVRGSVVIPQDNAAAIMAIIALNVVSQLPVGTNPTTIFANVITSLALCTVMASVLFLIIGKFRLADIVRYSPYPVIGGFLAGTGWLLVRGALSMMSGLPVSFASTLQYFEPSLLARWGPGMIFGLLLFALHKRFRHPLLVPAMLVLAILGFHLVLSLLGISTVAARSQGLLLDVNTQAGLWTPPFPAVLGEVHWNIVAAQIPNALAVSIICGISMLLNMSGLEMRGAHGDTQSIDLNKELVKTGLANLAAGAGGSTPGYMSLSRTLIGLQISPPSRVISLTVAVCCVFTIALGSTAITFFPEFVLGGMLISAGLGLLIEWLFRAWFRVSKVDYFIIVGILLTIIFVSVPAGVILGIAIECVLFVISYSRIGVVKAAFNLATLRSRVARPLLDSRLMEQKGEWVQILILQGHLFFGTANQLFDQVQKRLQVSTPHYILLDFQRVAGMDFSAIMVFNKIKRLMDRSTTTLVFANVSPGVDTLLRRELFSTDAEAYHCFEDLDRGLEWCEEAILEHFAKLGLKSGAKLKFKQLEQRIPKIKKLFDELVPDSKSSPETAPVNMRQDKLVANLTDYLVRHEVGVGDVLTDPKVEKHAIYFIERGKCEVRRAAADGHPMRLRVLGAGTCIGEIGYYSNRPASATVITLAPSIIYELSADALQRMEAENPNLAITFHRYMAFVLSERMILSTDELAIAIQ